MAGFFSVGETKTRPGVYTRYENVGGVPLAGAVNGIGAVIIKANWGPLNQVVDLDSSVDHKDIFGSELTVNIIDEIYAGGASRVKAVRVGSGGSKTSINLKDSSSGAGVDVVKIEAKYPGSRTFTVTIRESIMDTEKKECIIFEGTKEFEKVTFAAGATEPAALVAAFAKSANFIVTKLANGDGMMKSIAQQAMIAGTNPDVTTASYSDGFSALEASKWNVLCVDTNDSAVHALMHPFIQRIYQDGKLVMGVVAESNLIDFNTRLTNCAAFNDEKMHYVLNSWYDASGNLYDGYKAAARLCSMIASVASNASLTHSVIQRAVSLAEPLTNSQIEKALGKGALCLTLNANDQVWIESGINTLVTPSGDQDEGWKKIRRTKTRFELMDRIVATTDPLIGKVNNDADGRATLIAAAQGVINAMISESKLLNGSTIYEDSANPPMGDSAWFILAIDDIDSIEKAYLTFQFRFALES